MNLAVGARGLQTQPPLSVNPLLTALVVYVDSATGNDNNPGTQAQPFATLARACRQRDLFAQLRAAFTIQLVGVGPYVWPSSISASVCSDAGWYVIRGDAAVETVHASGTATGDVVNTTLGTSAGMGVDTQKGRWLKFTSGNMSGAYLEICENTDTSIVFGNAAARSSMGAVVAGNTFQIISPGTVVTGDLYARGLVGGDALFSTLRHVFFDLLLTGSIISMGAAAAITTPVCKVVGYLLPQAPGCELASEMASATVLGLPSAALAGAGCWARSLFSSDASLVGMFVFDEPLFIGRGSACEFSGLRLTLVGGAGSAVIQPGGAMRWAGFNRRALRIDRTVEVQGLLEISGAGVGLLKAEVLAGSCIRPKDGGRYLCGATWTGGTADAAGYGCDVRGGGVAFFSVLPTLTGGTPGSDLRTTATAVAANAALAAVPSSVDALGSPYGEVLARVA